MNELAKTLNHNFEGHDIRTIVDDDGNPWFVLADVCVVLDIANPSQAAARLDDDERAMFNIGRQGEANVINESGLYSLTMTSRKPEAKRFKKWITAEVLPSIRKTGAYAPTLTPAELQLAQAKLIVEHERQIKALVVRQGATESKVDDVVEKIDSVESKVDQVANEVDNLTYGCTEYSVMAYAKNAGINYLTRDVALELGKRCSKVSRKKGMPIGKIYDSRWGTVNSYHVDVLDEVFNDYHKDKK